MELRQIHAFARPLNSKIQQVSASSVELIALTARVLVHAPLVRHHSRTQMASAVAHLISL